jgi:pyruvate dehydrogenase kinase 2/3/4
MELECQNSLSPEKKISIVAVPSHLYHIMFELFKVCPLKNNQKWIVFMQNAMRATIEHIDEGEDLPPLQVRVVRGQEDLSIKVAST